MGTNAVETANIIASMAHDLRSPLNAVIGFSRLMLKGIDGPLSEMQVADLEAIYANGNAMLQMVDSLIDLAKAEAGWIEPRQTQYHLGPLLEKAVSLITPVAKDSGVTIDYATQSYGEPVRGDPSQAQKAVDRILAATVQLVGAGTITVASKPMQDGVFVHLMGCSPAGLSPQAQHSLKAFCARGVSTDDRIDATALQLLVGSQLLALDGSTLEIEEHSETTVCIALCFPLASLGTGSELDP